MNLRVLRSELQTVPLRTRMPFRYGIATMTDVPQVFLRIWVVIDGREQQGVASDCLPPKWFTKVVARPVEAEIEEMREVIEHAQEVAEGLRGSTVFALWRTLYAEQLTWAAKQSLPPLLGNFGVSLIERALLDAACRAVGQPFFQLLKTDAFGIAPEELYPELAGVSLERQLPAKPLEHVVVRHTVGLGDPLTAAEISAAERLPDGLPQSLDEAITHYKLRHFKIKLSGQAAKDAERLKAIAAVLRAHAPSDFRFSLDGNEQFRTLEEFRDFWQRLVGEPALQGLRGGGSGSLRDADRLLFVEQPLHRSVALESEVRRQFDQWPERPPIIIDESDGAIGDVSRALELGYAGASHKNCKGVIKGVVNWALLAARGAKSGAPLITSGEDLCTVGPVALQQDLAVMAALGIASVERNGHHYHAGLSQYPPRVQQRALAGHPDHYEPGALGWPTLRITDGRLAMKSINAAPFGSMFRSEDCEFTG